LTRMDKVMHIYDSEAEALDFIHTNLVFACSPTHSSGSAES